MNEDKYLCNCCGLEYPEHEMAQENINYCYMCYDEEIRDIEIMNYEYNSNQD